MGCTYCSFVATYLYQIVLEAGGIPDLIQTLSLPGPIILNNKQQFLSFNQVYNNVTDCMVVWPSMYASTVDGSHSVQYFCAP